MSTQSEQGSSATLLIIGVASFVTLLIIGATMLWTGDTADSNRASDGETLADAQNAELPEFGSVESSAQLIDQNGASFSFDDLDGTVWIASFIFTECRGTCPMMTAALESIQQDVQTLSNVKLVSITVDPENDTPEVLRQYSEKFGALQERWMFLTGSKDEIVELAYNSFHLAIQDSGTAAEPIIHSTKFILVDHNRQIRGYYDGLDEKGRKELVEAVRMLVLTAGKEANAQTASLTGS